MNLRYRVIVVSTEDGRFEASARAFASLRVQAASVQGAIDAARVEIARRLDAIARDGRQPPPADHQAVAVEMIALPFEIDASAHHDVQIEVTTGKVHKDGVEIAVRGGMLELLILLAMEPREVPVERLSRQMYPEVSADQAYDALKTCVYRTRKQLGAHSAIQTSERGYRLDQTVVTDVRFLPQIVRAIRSSCIPKALESRLEVIFARLAAGRPAAYMAWEWFEPYERSLRSSAREIGLYLCRRALRQAEPDRALEIAEALVQLDLLDETAHEVAIRAHLARSDPASAMQAFRRYAQDLYREHHMEPSPALRALVEPAPQ